MFVPETIYILNYEEANIKYVFKENNFDFFDYNDFYVYYRSKSFAYSG